MSAPCSTSACSADRQGWPLALLVPDGATFDFRLTVILRKRARRRVVFHLLGALLLYCGAALCTPALAMAEDGRYRAIPMAGGGYVFILDTREGHAWTWTRAGVGQTDPSSASSRFVYQGNVRKSMGIPEAKRPSVPPSPDRF